MSMTDQDKLLEMATRAIRDVSEAARVVAITPETRLVEDLSLDSLDMVAVFMRVQDAFGIEFDLDNATSFRAVGDLMVELDRHLSDSDRAAAA